MGPSRPDVAPPSRAIQVLRAVRCDHAAPTRTAARATGSGLPPRLPATRAAQPAWRRRRRPGRRSAPAGSAVPARYPTRRRLRPPRQRLIVMGRLPMRRRMLRLRRGAGGCPRRSSAHPLGQSVAPLAHRASHLTGWHLPPGGDAHLAPARQGEQWASARLLPGAPGIRRASCRFKRRRSMRAPPLRPGRPPTSWALASADSSTASCSTKSFNGITCSPTPVTIRAQRRRPGGQHARRRVLPPCDLGLGRHGDAADAPRGAATRVGAAVARSRGDGTRPTGVATDQQTTPDIRSRPRQPAGYSTDGRFERRAPTPTPRAGDRAPRARDRNL